MTKPKDMEEIERDDYLMTWDEFVRSIASGAFIDYDGDGRLATSTHVSDIIVTPSTVNTIKRPAWATHVVWYNK